jgi:hypothetical protein
MILFVVTPSLDSIEHKFNSKSIKFPKLHKVPTLEAININKPWTEWKERLRNIGVKPPKRGIELGWVTRGTRPKKPSSSRGFTCGARGARGSWGSWGLKIEHFFSSLFQQATTKFYFIFIFSRVHAASAWTHQPVRTGRARGYRGGTERGQGGELVCADAPMRLRGCECFTPRLFHNGCYSAFKSWTTQQPSSDHPSVRPSVIVRVTTLVITDLPEQR